MSITPTPRPVLEQARLITAILPKGASYPVIEGLRADKNIVTANMNYARGTGKMTPIRYRNSVIEKEKEIMTVIVEQQRADEIFQYIYEKADMDRPHSGLVFMQTLLSSSVFELPDVMEEA